ncbi:probable serine/threonine-protein kinase clkA [Gordionus sp. m RMFG-2023]|uniref:probable serine/threonine-protein kinase clkA n=1 Tax=Gordionus sp. m RMFG-2023 TaxID=3053472 RepID=UPI0031FC9015
MKQTSNNNVNINIEFPTYTGNGDVFLSRFEDIFNDAQISDIEKAGSFTRRLPDEEYIKLKSICSPTDFINPSILIEKFRLLHPRKSTSSKLLLFNAAVQGKNESYINWTEEETSVKHLERQRGIKVEENKQVVRYDDRHNPRSNNDNRQRWTARGHDFQRNTYQGNSYNPSYQGNNYNPRHQNYNAGNYNNVRANYPGLYNNFSRFENRTSYNNDNNQRFYYDYNHGFNRRYDTSRCTQRHSNNYNGNRGGSYACNCRHHVDHNNQTRYTNKINTINIEEIKEDDNNKIEKKEYNLYNLDINNMDADKDNTDNNAYKVTLKLNNLSTIMLVDTGSRFSIIPSSIAKSAGITELKKSNLKLTGYDGYQIKILGTAQISVNYEGVTKNLQAIVVNSNKSPLLGRTWLSAFKNILKNFLGNIGDDYCNDKLTKLILNYKLKMADKPICKTNIKLRLKQNAVPKIIPNVKKINSYRLEEINHLITIEEIIINEEVNEQE